MAIINLAFLLLLATFISAQKIEGKIFSSYQKDFVHDDQTLKVSLNYGQYETYTQRNGIFVFYNIPFGRYFLQVHSRNYVYESAFIDVYNKGTGVTKVNPLTRKRPTMGPENPKIQSVKDQMVFGIIQKIEYFEKADEFQLASLFQNQYAIMGIITVVLLIVLKKMPMDQMQQAAQPQ